MSFWRLEEPTEFMRLLLNGSSIGVEDDEGEAVEDDEGEAVEHDKGEIAEDDSASLIEDDDTSVGSATLLLEEDDDSARPVGANVLDESSEHDAMLKSTLTAIGARIL